MRITWISTVDDRVIDSRTTTSDAETIAQVESWLRLIGEDDLIVMEADTAPLRVVEPLGGPVPGVTGHPPVGAL